ncbi:hypothetical protein PMIN06_001123 [Paraphaeosphaeria minitans]|uniref:Uncharacterized protein n=1 Tax=Paraphaeosphaeria minitans TaxID=565426 RepID=A0A9P6GQF6_9PLEO|nr:hypothetical protein PMIN01_02150 [Paraphaeosphaeria minitans]
MSHYNTNQMTHIPNLSQVVSAVNPGPRDLHAFTSAFHDHLPAELRCNTYDFVLDDEATSIVSRDLAVRTKHYFKSLQGLQPCCHAGDFALNFAAMDPRVARELVDQVYSKVKHGNLSIQQVPTYLEADLFEVGVRPCDAALSAMDIRLDLEDKDISLIHKLFRPLLQPERRWSKDFKLNLSLHMTIPGSAAHPNIGHVLEALRALDGVILDAQSKSRSAEIHVTLFDSLRPGPPPFFVEDVQALSSKAEFEAEWLRAVDDYERSRRTHFNDYMCSYPRPIDYYTS